MSDNTQPPVAATPAGDSPPHYNPNISFFEAGYDPQPRDEYPVSEVIALVRGLAYAEPTKQCREDYAAAGGGAAGKDAIRDIKRFFPGVTLAGTFAYRANADWLAPSDLVQIDVDGLARYQLLAVMMKLRQLPWIICAWISPSGSGIKAAALVTGITGPDPKVYLKAWKAVTAALAALGIENDPQAKDAARLALLAHDPDAYFNPAAVPLDIASFAEPEVEPAAVPVTITISNEQPANKDVLKRAKTYLGKMPAAISGQGGHTATFKAAVALRHGFCLNRQQALAMLKKHYNPRCEPLWTDAELEHKVDDAIAKEHDKPRGWLRDQQRPGTNADEDIPEWQEKMLTNQQGRWLSHTCNVDLILTHDERVARSLHYNLLTATVEVQQAAWRKFAAVPEWTDADPVAFANWIAQAFEAKPAIDPGVVHHAAVVHARQHAYHPIQDYLKGLTWDGTPRIGTWLPVICHVADTPYHRVVGCRFLVSAVARVMDPGCKVDTMPILEGEQGTLKSTTLRTLFGNEWFTDATVDPESKDAAQVIRGRWCVEFAELHGMNRAEINALKQFLTRQEDRQRDAYARAAENHPRQCVFVGTTNQRKYLRDETGARRFWPVGWIDQPVDIATLQAHRDQLWAEARVRFEAGERWWLTPAEEELAREQQASRQEIDEWAGPIIEYLTIQAPTRTDITGMELWREVFTGKDAKLGRVESQRIAAIMRGLGWTACDITRHGKKGIKGYRRPKS